MPLVRISLAKGKPADHRRRIGDAVHRALVETIDVPPADRFQVLTEHEAGDLVYDAGYLGIARTSDNLVEVATENWSFGNGVASYAPPETVAA